MANSYGDTVLDFDLDFLHLNNDVTVVSKLEKQRKAVLVAKKKTIATDSLIKKYYEKKDVLDQIEKNLFESKEECKQVCIDYRNALQKVTLLEESEQKLRIANQELEERCAFSDNKYGALQSHTNQLQLLVKDYETKFEAMEIENQLQKSSTKEYEKKVSSLEREKDVMYQHILVLKDIVLGKKKLDKKALNVVKKYKGKSTECGDVSTSDSEAQDSCVEADDATASWKEEAFTDCDTQEAANSEPDQTDMKMHIPENAESPLKSVSEGKVETTKLRSPEDTVSEISNHHTDNDSDGSNEILLSVDTGRGSSLAFSDSDKGFLSPDHFCENTMPKSVNAPNNSATPSHCDSDVLLVRSPIKKPRTTPETEHRVIEDTTLRSKLSSINTASDTLTFVIDSPSDDDEEKEETPVGLEAPYDGFLKPPSRAPLIQNTSKSESQCLKINEINENVLSDDNSDDFEVSTILSKMSLHYSLITPLPPSPTSMSSCSAPETANKHSCQEAAEIREENKVLHASIASLAQQVMEIKSLLKNHCNNLVNGQTALATDNEIHRQTRFSEPDVTRDFKGVSYEGIQVDRRFDKFVKENESGSAQREIEKQNSVPSSISIELSPLKKPMLSKKEVDCLNNKEFPSEKQTKYLAGYDYNKDHDYGKVQEIPSPVDENIDRNENFNCTLAQKVSNSVPSSISKESEQHVTCPLKKPMLSKKEVEGLNNKEFQSEMQTQYLAGYYYNKDHDYGKVQGIPSPADEHMDRNESFNSTLAEKVSNEGELHETAESEERLIQVSDICDDTIVTDGDESSDLIISEKSLEFSLSSAYESIETPVVNTSIESGKNEVRIVERFVFDDPAFSADESLEVQEAEGTLSNNCDINLKLDDVCNNNHTLKKCRKSKLTKLEKIRRRLQPKNKIKTETPKKPTKKLRPRCAASNGPPDLPEKNELNDKAVYEKALAVVTELRARQKTNNEKTFITRACRGRTRSDRNDKLPDLEVAKRGASPQVLKFRQSPRLHRTDSKAVPTLPDSEICDKFGCETNSITTRSKSKCVDNTHTRKIRLSSVSVDTQMNNFNDRTNNSVPTVQQNVTEAISDGAAAKSSEKRNSLKRPCVDAPELETKRKLRSFSEKTELSKDLRSSKMEFSDPDNFVLEKKQNSTGLNNVNNKFSLPCKDYGDMDMFTETVETETEQKTASNIIHPKESILCKMIEKHGICKNKKFAQNKIPANITNSVCNTLEQSIATIKELPAGQVKAEMDRLVNDIKGLPHRQFLSGIIKFLKEPARKTESFNRITSPPAPPMTKSEQILLYLVSQVKTNWTSVNIVDEIMANIEFSLFRLGQAPEFDVIDSLSHFYAVLCRFSKAKNRLRLFILDAMYCLAYKAIPLIKTCIDVWMHVLPLAHMGMARNPLVICIVYLLHYYKCEDGFKRVQEIRFLLKKRYSFEMTEWNETRMLDLLKNAILEMRENPAEKKMLRTALIILAKRQGTKWCQNNLLKRLLLPIIDKEDQSERVKAFCVSMLGPLMKPYPNDMKVHCEIVLNQLFDMLEQNSSQRMQEAIIISLLYIQRHDPYRVTQALLSWRPQREVSQQLEDMLREFVRDKPIKVWTRILAKYALV